MSMARIRVARQHSPHPWPFALAAAATTSDTEALRWLARHTQFDIEPAMSIVIKRARPPRPPAASRDELQREDPYAYLHDDFAGLLIAV